MKPCFFIAFLIVSVKCYSLYGGYEKMFYYYAYLIDLEKNGGQTATKIARGCAHPCSFDQFIKYICDKPKLIPITNDVRPPVRATADKLEALDLNRAYNVKKIHQDAGNSIPTLFRSVSEFVEGNMGRVQNQEILDKARESIRGVKALRQFAYSQALIETLQRNNLNIVIKKKAKTLVEGMGQFEMLDLPETINANDAGMGIMDQVKRAADPSHRNNIKAAEEGCELICGI